MRKYNIRISFIIILIITVFMLIACGPKKYVNYTFNLDDSFNTQNTVNIFVLGNLSDKKKYKLYDELNDILIDLDNLFNVQNRGNGHITDLMKINQNAGIAPVEVSDEVIFVIQEAIKIAEFSKVDGVALFDITIAPVWKLWDFVNKGYIPMYGNFENPPAQEEIDEIIGLVDYAKVIVNEANKTVFLEEEGMELDLGSIVKGYAADKLKNHLISQGYTRAVIDVGRNILTVGSYFTSELEDRPWTIRVQTPYITNPTGNLRYYGTLYITDVTVVTSGVYEKYIKDEDGNEYHHILDPRTGFPTTNSVISVTVVTSESITGDGFSTVLFALGIEDGMKIVDKLDYLDAVWVIAHENKKHVYISSGLIDKYEFNTSVEEIGYVYKGVYNANIDN